MILQLSSVSSGATQSPKLKRLRRSASTCAAAGASGSGPPFCCFPRSYSTTKARAPSGWMRRWKSFTRQPWYTTTLLMKRRQGEDENRLAQYGRDLGMAFQIVDDVLDLTASESVLGKPVARDLREGKVTMAVIHALERCTPDEKRKIETVLGDRAFIGVTHADI